jgi:hypothetical protein
MFKGKFARDEMTHQRLRVGSIKHALGLPQGSVQSCPESLEGKAAASWTGEAYGGPRERAGREERQVCAPEGGKMVRTSLAAFLNRTKTYGSGC